ncbi:MAG: hypothetical protein GC159_05020 [Phycisphaera sp.]|nr:hypothetical protein [Phycisphaera sp.]
MFQRFTEVFDAIAARHPELDGSGFALAANVGELAIETLFELGFDLVIRRATQNEAISIREMIEVGRPSSGMMSVIAQRNPYETDILTIENSPTSKSFKSIELPAEQWRYHVITYVGTNQELQDFIDSSVLTRTRIISGPTFGRLPAFGLGPYSSMCGPKMAQFLEDTERSDAPFMCLNCEDLDDLRDVHAKLKSADRSLLDAIHRVQQLDQIPTHSPLRFLGYIAILESLITHAPKSTDPYDSLTRQVRQKMLLLGRRAKLAIPYDRFDESTGRDKLWTLLYSYRSNIAHGTTPDFKNRYKPLRDSTHAREFIEMATRSVIRQALEEPDLVADLQNC